MLMNKKSVRVGKIVSCLYPKNGNRNILTKQEGRIERVGKGRTWITIQKNDGSYRTLSGSKMVNAILS